MNRDHLFLLGGAFLLVGACATGTETSSVPEDDDTSGPTSTAGPGGGGNMPTSTTSNMPTSGPGAMGGSAGMGGAGGATTSGGGGSTALCGNGVLDSGEVCDDGNQSNADSCPDDASNGGTCMPATCGDGFVWSIDGGTETCDDGNANVNDDCPDGATGSCRTATCTDNFLHNQGTGDDTHIDCGGATCGACPNDGLLISEIVVTPTAGEFIEIHNPSVRAVSLDQIYLADYNTYFNITTASGPPGSADFRVQFPAGHSIPSGGHIVISTQSAADFNATYGVNPDFDFDMADAGAPAMTGEIDMAASLTNGDEMLVLFHWDGATDLVTDIDYLVWGDTSDAMDKSGVTVGGGTYAAETPVGSQSVAIAPVDGTSLAHCIYTEGAELETGGNGFNGHEETSEDVANTWDVVAPTPGTFNNCPVVAAVVRQPDLILHLDRLTFTELDSINIPSTISAFGTAAIARHPQTGVVYAILMDIGLGRVLARLDLSTGNAAIIGGTGTLISSIAFDDAGNLWAMAGDDFGGAGADQFGQLNIHNANFEVKGTLTHFDDGEAIAFHPPTGSIRRVSGSTPVIFDIDLTTFTQTTVTQSGSAFPGEASGLFWDPDDAHFVMFDRFDETFTVSSTGTVTDLVIALPEKLGGAVIQ